MLPRRAQKSGTGQSTLLAGRTEAPADLTAYPIVEEHYAVAADVAKGYTASKAGRPAAGTRTAVATAGLPGPGEDLDVLIARAREEMERAAKSLDFLAAAKFRDRMYELQKLKEENRR